MLKVAVVGATGYAGEELVKILLSHKAVKIASLSGKVEKEEPISAIFGQFLGRLDMPCKNVDIDEVSSKADFIFLALPHRVSMQFAPKFLKNGKKVIDLSADYRLRDTAAYKKWYAAEHTDAGNISKAAYGLPEIFKDKIKKAELIANPGCYPTGAILAVAPLIKKGLAKNDSIIIDAKSGVSGAGRNASLALHFCEVDENLKAYKVNSHQHKPEIDQVLSDIANGSVNVAFVPHLIPINRGILTAAYIKLAKAADTKKIIGLYKEFYNDAPFVRVLDEGKFPQIKDVAGTNFCDIGIKVDGELVIVISAIDNLVKGASGQAVQNMNIMCGFSETEGLL